MKKLFDSNCYSKNNSNFVANERKISLNNKVIDTVSNSKLDTHNAGGRDNVKHVRGVAGFLFAIIIALFAFTVSSCKDDTVKPNDTFQENHSIVGTWICIPELHPDITITLTVDLQNKVYLSTNPKDGKDFNMIIAPYMYLGITDGTQFIIYENNMYFHYPAEDDKNSGFEIIKLSDNTMKLKYFGTIVAYNKLITEYLFTKNKGD